MSKKPKKTAVPRKQIAHEEVRRLFDYRDGHLYWRVKVWTNVKPDDRAGYVKKRSGYRSVTIGGLDYFEHRLVYQWHHEGDIPDYIDHINGVRDDNRIENLRASNPRLNQGNRKATPGTSRFKGVSRPDMRWRATIVVNQQAVFIGSYATQEEAAAAYNKRALEVFGEHAQLNDIEGTVGPLDTV